MLLILLAMIVGTLTVHSINVHLINNIGENTSYQNILFYSLILAPIAVLVNSFYTYYYVNGMKQDISYFLLTSMSTGLTIVVSIFIGYYLDRNVPNKIELLSAGLILAGIGVFIYSKK